MMEPRWDIAYQQAFSSLVEAWEYRLVVSSVVTAICRVFQMDEVLVYCMFTTLTVDMLARITVLVVHTHRSAGESICYGLKRGMPRYIQYMLFILLSWACQLSIRQATGFTIPLINLMMCYLVLQDVSSIAGSLKALGVPLPPILERAISRGRRHIDRRVDQHFPGHEAHDAEHDAEQHNAGAVVVQPREPYTPAEHPNRRASDRRYGYHDEDDQG